MWEDHEPYPDVFHDRISEHFCHNLHQLGGHFQSSKRPIDADNPIISLLHLDSDYGIAAKCFIIMAITSADDAANKLHFELQFGCDFYRM